MKRVIRHLLLWAVAMLLWLAYTATVTPAEVIVGAVAAAVAATAGDVVLQKTWLGLTATARSPVRISKLLIRVLADTFTVFAALARHIFRRDHITGTFTSVEFEHGDQHDRSAATRRALVTVGLSLAPNTYVVGIDPESDRLFVHQLVRSKRDIREVLQAR